MSRADISQRQLNDLGSGFRAVRLVSLHLQRTWSSGTQSQIAISCLAEVWQYAMESSLAKRSHVAPGSSNPHASRAYCLQSAKVVN